MVDNETFNSTLSIIIKVPLFNVYNNYTWLQSVKKEFGSVVRDIAVNVSNEANLTFAGVSGGGISIQCRSGLIPDFKFASCGKYIFIFVIYKKPILKKMVLAVNMKE